jgi:small-conductance mechanosensitive channel
MIEILQNYGIDILQNVGLQTLYAKIIIDTCIIFFSLLTLFIFFKTTLNRILAQLESLSHKTENHFDDIIIDFVQNIKWTLFGVLSLILILKILGFPVFLQSFSTQIITLAVIYLFIKIGTTISDKVVEELNKKEAGQPYHIWGVIIKILIWALGIVFVLDNFGYDIKALLTGLGIGGIAVAMALKDILSDLFSSLSIQINKPFKVGNYISLDDGTSGTVRSIGLKNTRVKSVGGQEIVIPNSKLMNSNINNYGKIYNSKRSKRFKIGVSYNTSLQLLQQIPKMIENIITKEATGKEEFIRSNLTEYGDSALLFDVFYYLQIKEYQEYVDINERILLKIFETFEKKGIEFAYPTQEIIIKKTS